jgi:phage-related protein
LTQKIQPKPVAWVGDSREQVKSFPDDVRQHIGVALFDVQKGDKPVSSKPFKGVAGGVFELVTRHDGDTFRTVYAVQIGTRVYVLHAFQKKSPTGIKTAQKDIDLIHARYKRALEMEREQNHGR